MSACFHRKCGEQFGGLTAFDRHLRWHRTPPWVSCLPPAEVGLVWSDARNSWSARNGFLSAADFGGIPTRQDGGISPERSNCSASEAS